MKEPKITEIKVPENEIIDKISPDEKRRLVNMAKIRAMKLRKIKTTVKDR